MSSTRATAEKILDYLLDHPAGASAEGLVKHLKITKTAVREHLLKLQDRELVSYRDESGRVGRPKRLYTLTQAGHEALPRQYSWLSLIMLEHLVTTTDSQRSKKFMSDLADKISAGLKEKVVGIRTPKKLIERISELLTQLGYRASIKQSDLRKGAVLEATNCVYHSVAQKHPELCRFDTRLIENLSGLDVELTECIAKGGSVCRFCLTIPEKKSAHKSSH